ncbi:hypothetical protein EVAR_12540_1 [Eumeta japonica]|uniref:Uncharacterized protein n=1 Tax=Eumeta variegata TaxID=151549 RepID=A0A4C1TPS9_EUMVA|nr:hypothetical protein EVAR_12540_1 [Eumeta japonica]
MLRKIPYNSYKSRGAFCPDDHTVRYGYCPENPAINGGDVSNSPLAMFTPRHPCLNSKLVPLYASPCGEERGCAGAGTGPARDRSDIAEEQTSRLVITEMVTAAHATTTTDESPVRFGLLGGNSIWHNYNK